MKLTKPPEVSPCTISVYCAFTSIMNYIYILQACYSDSDCWGLKANSKYCGSSQYVNLKQMICTCLKPLVHLFFFSCRHCIAVSYLHKKMCCSAKLVN